MWAQPFAMTGSNLACVEENHVDAAARECRHVGGGSLALRAGEGRLHRGQIVERQHRDQMQARRSGGAAIGPWLTSYFLKPGIFLAIGMCFSK